LTAKSVASISAAAADACSAPGKLVSMTLMKVMPAGFLRTSLRGFE